MSSPAIPRHLLKTAYLMYQDHMKKSGIDVDELMFISGAAAVVGIVVGTLDMGIREGTPTRDVISQLIEETDQYRAELLHLENQARERQRKMQR